MRCSLTLLSIALFIVVSAAYAQAAVLGGGYGGTGYMTPGYGTQAYSTPYYGSTYYGRPVYATQSYSPYSGVYGSGYAQPYGYPSYTMTPATQTTTTAPTASFNGYSAGDPAQRGIEAVKLAALEENPSSNMWGYDYPYSMSYRAGTPMYIGHNMGMPSGAIYEFPALMPNGVPEPTTFYGNPEYSMFMNYGQSFPWHGPPTSVWY